MIKSLPDYFQREQKILEAYQDFRGALKQSEVLALEVLDTGEGRLAEAKARVNEAMRAVEAGVSDDPAERARLEMERDQQVRRLQQEDKRYQIAKDLAENLSVSYNTTEVVMARLVQTTDVKERVYSQAVSFFGTNETVFTALNASFTSLQGLHESTQTLEAMKEGVNKSLETLAEVGDKVQEDALRAGYGPTIRADAVKKLVEYVVNFQSRSREIIDEMRVLATKNAEEIRESVEDGKQRLAKLIQEGGTLPPPTGI